MKLNRNPMIKVVILNNKSLNLQIILMTNYLKVVIQKVKIEIF